MSSLPVHLPQGFTPLVAVGDTVTAGQPLATKSGAGTAVINLATELGLSIDKTGKAVRKNPGDVVAPGDVIASRAGFLGMGEQKVVSSVAGSVVAYERRTGELTLRIAGEAKDADETYPSPVAGEITICDNGEIVIESRGEETAPPALGVGGSVTAEVYCIHHEEHSPVPLHLLNHDVSGKIVAGRAFDREGLTKLLALEAAGIVTTQVEEDDLAYVAQKSSLPLVTVSEEEFKKVMKKEGKEITLDGEQKKVVL